ncbi:hypothetical protein F0562_031898 [Nyssa sinensis]|uniref:TF-B3 domain-containing protein n=1 Tax=Nyssa sinensis TaxID=561372 RepID=A0A5J5AZH2_9ASTE|nr:hypothetical protein F0562_031898 [Nyssa sinensis]
MMTSSGNWWWLTSRMNGRELSFKKKLSSTDLTRNLEIPNMALHLPDGNQTMRVLDQNGRLWHFKCPRRRGGRRCLTDQWRDFASTVTPRKGDILRFYFSAEEGEYFVELERRSIQLFGVTICIELGL